MTTELFVCCSEEFTVREAEDAVRAHLAGVCNLCVFSGFDCSQNATGAAGWLASSRMPTLNWLIESQTKVTRQVEICCQIATRSEKNLWALATSKLKDEWPH